MILANERDFKILSQLRVACPSYCACEGCLFKQMCMWNKMVVREGICSFLKIIFVKIIAFLTTILDFSSEKLFLEFATWSSCNLNSQ